LNHGLTAALPLLFAAAGLVGSRRAGSLGARTSSGLVAALLVAVVAVVVAAVATPLILRHPPSTGAVPPVPSPCQRRAGAECRGYPGQRGRPQHS